LTGGWIIDAVRCIWLSLSTTA